MHVDPELCTYVSHDSQDIVDAERWPGILRGPHESLFDISVKLPNETNEISHEKYSRTSIETMRYSKALDHFGISWRRNYSLRGSRAIVIDDEVDDRLESQIRHYTELRRGLQEEQRLKADQALLPLINSPSQTPRNITRPAVLSGSSSPDNVSHVDKEFPPPPTPSRKSDNSHESHESQDSSDSNESYNSDSSNGSYGIYDIESSDGGGSTTSSRGDLCPWPGCFGQSARRQTIKFWSPLLAARDKRRTTEKTTAAQSYTTSMPQEDPNCSHRSVDRSCYFRWKVRSIRWSSGKVRSREFPSNPRNPFPKPGDSSSEAADEPDEYMLLRAIHQELTNKGVNRSKIYVSQSPATLRDVQREMGLLDDSAPQCVSDFVRSITHLASHFIETGLDSDVELRLYGSLFSILRVNYHHVCSSFANSQY